MENIRVLYDQGWYYIIINHKIVVFVTLNKGYIMFETGERPIKCTVVGDAWLDHLMKSL